MPSTNSHSPRRLRALAGINTALITLFGLITVGSIAAGVHEYSVLDAMRDGDPVAYLEANNLAAFRGRLALIQTGALALCALAVLAWTFFAGKGARALGATDMRFSPGLAVGLYFIPVANLFMPHRAVIEIWRASHDPTDWRSLPRPALVNFWWLAWVVSIFSGRAFALLWTQPVSDDDLIRANLLGQGSDVAALVAGALLLVIIWRITGRQADRSAPLS